MRVLSPHSHLGGTCHLPRGGATTVDVDGIWSTICCRREVAVSMVRIAAEGRGEGTVGDPRKERGILYPLFSPEHCEEFTTTGLSGPIILERN